jgi:hypothetical protein
VGSTWAKIAIGACLACLSAGFIAPAPSAAQPKLWQVGENCAYPNGNAEICSGAAGETYQPTGIATDPVSGHLYVGDQGFSRINEFDAWGLFVRAWGWGVRDGSPELQSCTAQTGCQQAAGSLGYGAKRGLGAGGAGEFAGPRGIAVDSEGGVYVVDSALGLAGNRIQKFDSEGSFLRTWGGGVVSGGAAGTGDLSAGSTKVVNLATTAKAFEIGQALSGAGIPAGTIVSDLGLGTLTLSRPATASATGVAIVAAEGAGNVPTNEKKTVTLEGSPTGGTFTLTYAAGELSGNRTSESKAVTGTFSGTELTVGSFHVGDQVVGEAIPAGATITAIDTATGSLTLSASATASASGRMAATETTTPIPYNATAAEVREKLEALAAIGVGNVAVEGPAGGPWSVEFKGPLLGDVNLEPWGAAAKTSGNGSALTPAGAKVAVATARQGASAAEVCAVAGECRSGIEGSGSGQFGGWPPISSFLAISPTDQVYVGEQDRIQSFDTEGAYQGQIALPEPGTVGALTASPKSGHLFFSYKADEALADSSEGKTKQPNVHELDPATGEEVRQLTVGNPIALASDTQGNVYAFEPSFTGSSDVVPGRHPARIFKFNSTGSLAEVVAENEGTGLKEENEFSSVVSGLAANPVTEAGLADLYLANRGSAEQSFLSAYGPPPEKWPPPPAAPSIDEQYAISVGAKDATLGAAINPHFWKDTTFHLEYGTGKCSAGGCEALTPDSSLGGKVVDTDVASPGVFLTGLAPATTYHYRFVSESSGGGPVTGKGGTEAEDGAEATFTTFALPVPNTSCPNQALRSGASASLPDCRAYEMVSPVDKAGGDVDVAAPQAQLEQSSTSGDGFTYSSNTAFAEPKSAPFTSQYLAERDPVTGWSSKSISAPQEGLVELDAGGYAQIASLFKIFSPDLSTAWNETLNEPVLAPGAVAGYANLYRRDNSGEGSYQACTTAAPLEEKPGRLVELEGVSADQRHAIFLVANRLTPDAAEGDNFQLYECSLEEGEVAAMRLVSVRPDASASRSFNTAGSPPDDNTLTGFYASFQYYSLDHAISEDGSRVFWSASTANSGKPGSIYLRVNAPQPESAHLHGTASGTGDLIGPATGTGTLLSSSFTVSSLETTSKGSGEFFTAGQEIASPAPGLLAAGTKVVSCVPSCGPAATSITLSAKPLKTKAGAELTGLGSATVSSVTATAGAFQAGQEVSGTGIPAGTTVLSCSPACGEAATSLTLSAKATETKAAVALSATSSCTEAAKACTYQASPGSVRARYSGATPSGSRALLETVPDKERSIYLFDTAKAIAGEDPRTLIAGGAKGVLGASEDLSRVYFLSEEAIGGEGEAGKPNLYLYEGGEAPATRLIATLSVGDDELQSFTSVGEWPTRHTARVSVDGETLFFMSASKALAAQSAGYDNTDLISGEADGEIYRYDASSEALACVSCNPTGARPSVGPGFDVGIEGHIAATSLLPPPTNTLYRRRPASTDGRRVFFESLEALTLTDTNGHVDVYEWEQAGSGDCEAGIPSYVEASGGCIGLISSGKSSGDVAFFDASEDGSDVFFKTIQSLLPQDPGSADVYDARVEGGFAPEAEPPAACEGEACQGTPEAPNDPTPASSSFEGAGNVPAEPLARTPKPCAKGKVRRHSKCVAKKHKKAHKRASHKRRTGR